MTKTKVDSSLPSQAASSKAQRHGQESDGKGDGSGKEPAPQPQKPCHRQTEGQPENEQKHSEHRALLPGRSKDVRVRSPAKGRGSAGAATFGVKSRTTQPGNRAAKRNSASEKELKSEMGKHPGKATLSAAGVTTGSSKPDGQKKVPDSSDVRRKNYGCAKDKQSSADSGSEVSEGISEDHKLLQDTMSIDNDNSSRDGATDGERTRKDQRKVTFFENCEVKLADLHVNEGELALRAEGEGRVGALTTRDSTHHVGTSLGLADLTEDLVDGIQGELLKEIEELRSENDYLKDEMEELRSEMLEMRDAFLEEGEGQLQELRGQLEHAHRTCRVLQYRLRKAERRSMRVARTGQVDGELVRTLEQDVKVAKDVSVRLHAELSSTEKNRAQLEKENQELRERLLSLEVSNQVLRAEADKARENSLRKRGIRTASKAEKATPQEDMADLKCQLHFAKEETMLMCKKLTKTAKESEGIREELAKFRSLYGDVDTPLSSESMASAPHTREAELKVHLKLVEEEANLLSRRIVELEVENRGLRAEMEDLRGQELELGGVKRHLQYTEEEAKLLQCPPAEGEEQNLVDDRGLCKPEADSSIFLENSCSVISKLAPEDPVSGSVKGFVFSHENQDPTHHLYASERPLNQMAREGPVGGERDPLEESRAEAGQVCGVTKLKTCETWLAVRDQARLISRAIQQLAAPVPDPCAPFLSTERTLLSPSVPLASRLEALQVLLLSLLEGADTLGSPVREQVEGSESTSSGPAATPRGQDDIPNCPDGENAKDQIACAQAQPDAQMDLEMQQQDLLRLVLRLRCFLEQWHQCRACDPHGKDVLQVARLKDLCLLLEGEGPDSRGEELSLDFSLLEKSHKQTCTGLGTAMLALKGALQDLSATLQEEHQRSLELAQQLSQVKANWEVERADLVAKTLQHNIKKYSPEREVSDSSPQRMKTLACCGSDGDAPPGVPTACWEADTETRGQPDTHYGLAFTGAHLSVLKEKNWQYLTEDAATLTGTDPFKTWDCPVQSRSFPGLDLAGGGVRRSHTAPVKSSLRIYYSPPSVRRVTSVTSRPDSTREQPVSPPPLTSTKPGHRAPSFGYETWLYQFSEQNLLKNRHSVPSLLPPFPDLGMSANLSDDMKEMTYGMRHVVSPCSLERRVRDVASQTCCAPGDGLRGPRRRSVSVGLQTEESVPVTSTPKPGSLRDSSLALSRSRQLSVSLEKMPSRVERPRCGSPKLQRRLSCSALTSPLSSTRSRLGLWSLPHRTSSGSAWARSTTTRDSPMPGSLPEGPSFLLSSGADSPGDPDAPESTKKEASTAKRGGKGGSAPKYGIVQEFFRNVCGRGHTANPAGMRSMARVTPSSWPDGEQPASHGATMVKTDTVSKIVNRRFMKQNSRGEHAKTCRTPSAGTRTVKGSGSEDAACDCTSQSLTSCFARASCTASRHPPGQCKLHSVESACRIMSAKEMEEPTQK